MQIVATRDRHIIMPNSKQAVYFGYKNGGGHFLQVPDRYGYPDPKDIPTFPWSIGLLDGGLLQNGKVPDMPDGRVFSTCGGTPLWIAFFWWDRSGDKRGASNSGFYVQGFELNDKQAAFDYACSIFPDVVARQKYPLVLQQS